MCPQAVSAFRAAGNIPAPVGTTTITRVVTLLQLTALGTIFDHSGKLEGIVGTPHVSTTS
jgi:hypothetical protein